MTLLLWGMVLALLIPIAVVCRPCSVWDRMAAFGEIERETQAADAASDDDCLEMGRH